VPVSHQDGRVRVSWRVEPQVDGRRARLTWPEHDGPPVKPPECKGFGTRLIERAGTFELEGEAELDYARDGLRCEVSFPVT
jgi:two-component sensor histidine kinase